MESSAIPEVTRELFSSAQSIALDSMVLGTLVILFLIYALVLSKGKVLSLLFSFYIAGLLFILFPFADRIKYSESLGLSEAVFDLGVFIIFLLISVLATRNTIRSEFRSGAGRRVMAAALFAIISTVFALAIVWRVLPDMSSVHKFGTPISHIVNTDNPATWWILTLPVLLSFTVRGKRRPD